MSETAATYRGEFALRDQFALEVVHVHGRAVPIPVERKFATIESIQVYVDKVLSLNWVRKAYPRAASPLRVVRKPSKTANEASCGGGVMQIPINTTTRWALREIVVLHEVAHHLTPGCGHSKQFRDCLAHLVDEIIAPEAGWLLRTNWWAEGLTVSNAVQHA